MTRTWIDGPLVSSYQIGPVIVGQCVMQSGKGPTRTYANFDLTGLNDSNTGPKEIADAYKSMEEARTAMEQYWEKKEPA